LFRISRCDPSFETRQAALLRIRFPLKSMTYLTLRSERSERLEGPVERLTGFRDEVSLIYQYPALILRSLPLQASRRMCHEAPAHREKA